MADDPKLLCAPADKAKFEARNGVEQLDYIAELVNEYRVQDIRESHIQQLWRFNWIHPFAGGNGRTARALTYLLVCIDNKAPLPGTPSMPALIYRERDEYVTALRAADASERAIIASLGDPSTVSPIDVSSIDVTDMRNFLKRMLTKQLAAAIDALDG